MRIIGQDKLKDCNRNQYVDINYDLVNLVIQGGNFYQLGEGYLIKAMHEAEWWLAIYETYDRAYEVLKDVAKAYVEGNAKTVKLPES